MNTAPNYLRLIPYQPVTVFGNVTDNSNKLAILFEQLVQDAPDLIYTVNDQSKFSFVNIRSMELTEYTRDELLNMHYLELVDPAYVEIVKNFYLEQKVNGPEVTYFEFPMITKSGKRIWIGQKVVRLSSTSALGFQAIARDITDKKNGEEKLLAANEKYKNLFENAIQGIFQSTVDGTLLSANPALLKMLGYDSLDELSKINLSDLYVDKEDRERLYLLLSIKGHCSDVELKLKRKDGRIITVLEHSRTVVDKNGDICMYEGILDDITTKKAIDDRMQEYVSALKASEQTLRDLQVQKNKMYSIISHDLRSPFAGIIGFCDLLLQNYDLIPRSEHQEYLSLIKDSAQAQLRFINDLLDFTKLDSGQIRLERKHINVYVLVRNSIVSLLGIAKQKEITINNILPTDVAIIGDERWLQQAFTNIIGNALKFTKPHGTITISLSSLTETGCVVDIADTGVGIAANMLSKLLKVEEKYTTTGTDGERGNGFGLSVCNEIMVNHGGSISIESKVGAGTVVHLTFPQVVKNEHMEILIVDDDPIVRLVHSNYVAQLFPSCKTINACDGVEALRQIEVSKPQLIITDIIMPNMDGYEFINILKKNPITSEIPVIVVAATDSVINREALLLSGARAVITKPLLHEEFAEIATKILHEDCELVYN